MSPAVGLRRYILPHGFLITALHGLQNLDPQCIITCPHAVSENNVKTHHIPAKATRVDQPDQGQEKPDPVNHTAAWARLSSPEPSKAPP